MRLSKTKFLTPHPNPHGYMHVSLNRNGKSKTVSVHRLVLETFVGPRPEGMEACHGSGGKTDNSLANIEWNTKIKNAADKVTQGSAPIGAKNPKARLDDFKVVEIYKRANNGEEGAKLAMEFNVSPVTVSHILCGRTWAHITGARYKKGRISMTSEIQMRIAELKNEGKSLAEIANELSISRATAFRHSKTNRGL